MYGPFPDHLYPMPDIQRVVFLKNTIRNPRIIVGDYSYYDDADAAHSFEDNVLYHFDFIGDSLHIGKFCQIASGATFIMNGANHRVAGFSTYPFAAFHADWRNHFADEDDYPNKGDTIIGHDVWIGTQSLFMPGVKVGNGAIIATRAVVTRDVPPYTIVGGNPARMIRQRFDDATIARLEEIAWWHWPIEKITRNIEAISTANLALLEKAAKMPE